MLLGAKPFLSDLVFDVLLQGNIAENESDVFSRDVAILIEIKAGKIIKK
jgi:hypothetical protein